MSYTKFGEALRILRVKHHEVMGDLAKVLDVAVPFLSAVETGKKNVPASWLETIARHYSLSPEEKADLSNAAEESKTQMKLDLRNASHAQRSAAFQFARSFEDIDEDMAQKIANLLERSGKS